MYINGTLGLMSDVVEPVPHDASDFIILETHSRILILSFLSQRWLEDMQHLGFRRELEPSQTSSRPSLESSRVGKAFWVCSKYFKSCTEESNFRWMRQLFPLKISW
eukprot:TRINITY_DN19309_c0_g1::TRINITY_DN19309_c0_g1_i1::g.15775::m.15775 TRINITY_DN19309_c0_g1::TRINITY_DN19309_c0_g1_i1::g.15775  ORF type:complete len:106 (-),score=1.26 TRINITY_DN19309_c0_g1_i1:272-589(-)